MAVIKYLKLLKQHAVILWSGRADFESIEFKPDIVQLYSELAIDTVGSTNYNKPVIDSYISNNILTVITINIPDSVAPPPYHYIPPAIWMQERFVSSQNNESTLTLDLMEFGNIWNPLSACLGADGGLYYFDNEAKVKRIDPMTRHETPIAGGASTLPDGSGVDGIGVSASFYYISGMCSELEGGETVLWVTDVFNPSSVNPVRFREPIIRKIICTGLSMGTVTTVPNTNIQSTGSVGYYTIAKDITNNLFYYSINNAIYSHDPDTSTTVLVAGLYTEVVDSLPGTLGLGSTARFDWITDILMIPGTADLLVFDGGYNIFTLNIGLGTMTILVDASFWPVGDGYTYNQAQKAAIVGGKVYIESEDNVFSIDLDGTNFTRIAPMIPNALGWRNNAGECLSTFGVLVNIIVDSNTNIFVWDYYQGLIKIYNAIPEDISFYPLEYNFWETGNSILGNDSFDWVLDDTCQYSTYNPLCRAKRIRVTLYDKNYMLESDYARVHWFGAWNIVNGGLPALEFDNMVMRIEDNNGNLLYTLTGQSEVSGAHFAMPYSGDYVIEISTTMPYEAPSRYDQAGGFEFSISSFTVESQVIYDAFNPTIVAL